MLDNIFYTTIFFILDHFLLLFAASLISLLSMKFCYKTWQDQSRALDARYLSLIILILSAMLLLLFFIGVIYIIGVMIAFLPDLRKAVGK
jgi:hypothetical protein